MAGKGLKQDQDPSITTPNRHFFFQDSSDFSRRSAKLNNYYESFRRDMISILGNVKLPDEAAASAARGGGCYGGAVGADPSLTATNSSSGTCPNLFHKFFIMIQTSPP